MDLFLDGWIDNRVRVLIFGKTEIARLRYLTTAFKYRSRAQVGYVKIDDPESLEVVSKYEIPGDSDSLLLFQENTRIPVVRISMQVRIISKYSCTVWKFHDFSITNIFREIIFRNFGGPKTAILAHLEALESDFNEFLHFLKAEIYQINHFYSL